MGKKKAQAGPIRLAKAADCEQIYQLVTSSIDTLFAGQFSEEEFKAWKAAYLPEYLRQLLNERYIFVYEEAGELIGTIQLNGPEILGLYVQTDAFGKGYGRALVNHLEDFARKRGQRYIELTSTDYAHIFYQKMGYKDMERVAVHWHGAVFYEMRMMKRL